ncbi:E3 ubiquitin-protein ligase ATL41-like [Malania oleifera]|uniref:E3 ubiquitin-protein ligase ATL41-like n=1 Tax=Malania oleifera TaxID=397392 RepID=UPI0025AE0FB7|nr:E3 ubiquitin-protein ligase ATL41-like [Malania oleifera]
MNFDDHHDDDEPFFHHRNSYDLNSKIMLSAIISLSVVVLVVIALHVYARFALRRQARRRSATHHAGLVLAHHANHSPESPSAGLEPAIIAALPTFPAKKYDGGRQVGGECAVCLSVVEEEEIVRLLPNCKHAFHKDCIDTWLRSNPTCPVCRGNAKPRLEPESRESPARFAVAVAPSAPTPRRLERASSTLCGVEATSSEGGAVQNLSGKAGGSSSRLGSFRRMLSWEISSRSIQTTHGQEDGNVEDLERQ